jgi:hypothetical protein
LTERSRKANQNAACAAQPLASRNPEFVESLERVEPRVSLPCKHGRPRQSFRVGFFERRQRVRRRQRVECLGPGAAVVGISARRDGCPAEMTLSNLLSAIPELAG